MPNIYLRVSKYVAAFIRSNGKGSSLPFDEPIVFSPYTHEHVVLVNGLRIVPEDKQHIASCYSQSAWSNMMRGRLPQGGRQIIVRNPDDYLSYSEVCTLEGSLNRSKTDSYDFLCLHIPREIYSNGRVERTNKSYTLTTPAAMQLRKLMRENFIRIFLDFERRNRIFAEANHINRTDIEIMERFFLAHDIPVSHDARERDTLRRLKQRWMMEADYMANQPSIIQDGLVTRIDKEEMIL